MNQRGISMVELVVMGALAVVVVMGAYSVLQISVESERKVRESVGLRELQNRITYYLNDSRSISNTIANTTNMACLQDGTSCTPPGPYPFEIFDANANPGAAQPVADFRQGPNQGFSASGQPCNTYPNAPCVYRYRFSWQPNCGADGGLGRCRAPAYYLRATLESAMNPAPIHLASFNVEVTRSAAGESLSAVCASLDGVLSGTECKIEISKSCSTNGWVFVGMDANNRKICQPVSAKKCPLGSYLWKVGADGVAYCRSGCYTQNIDCHINLWTDQYLGPHCPTTLYWRAGGGIDAHDAWEKSYYLKPNANRPVAPPPVEPTPPSGDGDSQ